MEKKLLFPLIDRVNANIESIRKMDFSELEELCRELRIRISQVVTEKGGHLAPCLGVVELIAALHHTHDFKKDKLVFDVGHQAYAHKILTGRNDDFETIRSKDGLGGFPWGKESPYDVFRSGHASTAVSTSVGLVEAYKHKKEKRRVVVLVGDGSMTGGMNFEGLNNAGGNKQDITVILNDNGMSISPTVGALSHMFTKVRQNSILRQMTEEFMSLLNKIPLVGDKFEEVTRFLSKEGVRILSPWQMFSTMGFSYYGPIDGHNMKEVVEALNTTKSMKGPILIHALTEKGRGYMPLGTEEEIIYGPHAMSPPSSEKKSLLISWSQAFSDHLIELAKKDKRVIAITAAMPDGTKLEKFQELFPERFYDVGISEQHATGFASGLSYGGMIPVFCVYSTFFQRAYDQLFHEFVLQDNLPVLFGIDRAGLVGEDGASHQGVYDIAYMRVYPKVVLMSPKDHQEMKAMIDFSINNKLIAAIRYPKGNVPSHEVIEPTNKPIELGIPEILTESASKSKRIAIVAYGVLVEEAVKAQKKLKEEGIELTVVNARFAKPLNRDFYTYLAGSHEWILSYEEGTVMGGLGEAIASMICNEKAKIKIFGVPDELIEHMKRSEQMSYCKIDSASMIDEVRSLLS